MPVTKLPFHADHIGSLIRPESVATAQDKASKGEITQDELKKVQSAAISEIVQKQLDNDVRAISNGEFDRKYYFSGFFEKLEGMREIENVPWDLARLSAPPIAALKKAGKNYPMAVVCEGKIKYNKSPYLENWRQLKSTVSADKVGECKFTMPPPCYFHLRLAPGKCYSKDAYSNDADFFADLADAYRKEFKTLYDDGLRNIQIDDPTLAYFCSDDMLAGLKSDGEDPDKLFDLYLQAHNDTLVGRPDDLHVGLHICRGNFSKSMHFSEGSYEKIAERFFKTLNYDTFYLEYDNPRSGGFEPLRFLPQHKNVVLGVVTTKEPELEDKETIKQKVLEAAKIIAEGQGRTEKEAMENIGISPQCGFASVAVGAEGMTEEKMFAKLALVKEVAKELWPDRA
jgi:methionine synthase II (cobalamin-independent)